jgi:hypothetical protein
MPLLPERLDAPLPVHFEFAPSCSDLSPSEHSLAHTESFAQLDSALDEVVRLFDMLKMPARTSTHVRLLQSMRSPARDGGRKPRSKVLSAGVLEEKP